MEKMSYEELLKELEQIVKDLENKEIALDDAVKKYQRGIELASICHKMLKEAESVIVKEAIDQ